MDPLIEIEVEGESQPDYALNIALTHTSSEPLVVYEHSLPWVGSQSMLLVAIRADAMGTPIDKHLPIDDPGTTRITINPGDRLTGRILITNRFPSFANALEDHDVVVFWTYQLQPVDGVPLKRAGGYVVFPKL